MLLWIDSFASYGAIGAANPSGVLSRKYPTGNSSSIVIAAGRPGGLAIDFNTTGYTSGFGSPSLTAVDTVVLGFAAKFDVLPAAYTFCSLYDGANRNVKFVLLDTGEITVVNDDSTTLGTTSGAGITTGTWQYVEIKVKTHVSAGTIDIRVNEIPVLSATGKKTKCHSNSYSDVFGFGGIDGTHFCLTDLYFLDTSGTANNNFLGNMQVTCVRPNSAGSSTQFTPDSGSNYSRVNEAVCGDNSNYVEGSTPGHKDLYNYEAVPPANIYGVMACTDCRETDASPFSLVTVCKSGATESNDSAQSIGTTDFVTKVRVIENDPNTSAAWSKTNLDAAQFGVKVA
jgi:hypothetical protein